MANSSKPPPAGADSARPEASGWWRFGLFELEMSTGELRRAGRRVHLAPQPARVLTTLVQRAGHIVTRDELKEAAWGDNTFVDFEQGLNFCMKQIRAALGDEADNPRFVETVPRRGYRFIAPVETAAPAKTVPAAPDPPLPVPTTSTRSRTTRVAWMAVAVVVLVAGAFSASTIWSRQRGRTAKSSRTMIAVLPFENLSGDPAQDYFSEGFTEELIAQLGHLDPVKLGVIARTSTLGYRHAGKGAAVIGHELGVDHLVEGTVRRSGSRVRINAQLIRVSDQSHVWAEIYDGEVRDILALQHEVAMAVARQVVATLGPSTGLTARAVDPSVYDLYLQGRYYWNSRRGDQVEKAIAMFREAVRRDPGFAPAYAGLADGLIVGSRAASLAAAEKALSLDDHLAEAHTAKAYALMHMLKWTAAEESFRRAVDLDPSYVPARYFYSEYLFARGRCPEAREHVLKGLALDPLSAIATHTVGVTLYYCRAYDEALPYLRRALELDPQHHWSHYRIGLVLEQRQMYDEAIAEFEQSVAPIIKAYTYAVSGRPAQARRLIQDNLALRNEEPAEYQLGLAYTALGDQDEALKWLTRVVRHQAFQAPYLKADPRLDAIRSRPEFRALLRDAGLE
jgi:TolB-like protein/DNA-binding winged helix-turn-helix (wHTH) protein